MTINVPNPRFVHLSRAEVLSAINDSKPNPVATEVARLLNFEKMVERLGYIPARILVTRPGSAIETVARELFRQVVVEQVTASKNYAGKD